MLATRRRLDRTGYAVLGVLYLADALACRARGLIEASRDNLTHARRVFVAARE